MSRPCIITALPAETRPLLDALTLRQVPVPHLRLYGSEQFLLLETGIGKLNAAATTSAMLNACPDVSCIANIGIAGGCFEHSTLVVAHQVLDAASGAQWYPHLPSHPQFRAQASARVETIDKPCTNYQQGVLFDMEASGIFNAATRYLATSQILSIKLVSDNAQHSVRHITKQSVITLVEQSVPRIMTMLDVFAKSIEAVEPAHADALETTVRTALNAAHHSVNDERLLRQLAGQYIALNAQQPELDTHSANAATIRTSLQRELDKQPFVYGAS